MSAAPIFILAAPFSGAAALAARLDAHPQLCAISETSLFVADTVAELLEIFELGQGGHGDGLLRAIAQLESGEQNETTIDEAARWLAERAHWRCSAVLQHLIERAAPRRLVMPDTDAVLRPDDLCRLARDFAQAELIQLLRHPWTQGALFARWLDDRLFVPADFRDHAQQPAPIDPQLAWLRIQRNIAQWLQPAFGARLRICRDEDLRSDEALRALCTGLRLDAAALTSQAIEDWPFAGYGPRNAPYGVEAELVEDTPPLPDWLQMPRLEAPLPWRADGRGFSADVIALARQYRY